MTKGVVWKKKWLEEVEALEEGKKKKMDEWLSPNHVRVAFQKQSQNQEKKYIFIFHV